MKSVKFILILLGLLFWLNGSAQCFSMTVVQVPSVNDNMECYQVSVTTIGSTSVIISDGIHPEVTCNSSCSFTWCYESGMNGTSNYNVTINCRNVDAPNEEWGCKQRDGCIVVVGNGY